MTCNFQCILLNEWIRLPRKYLDKGFLLDLSWAKSPLIGICFTKLFYGGYYHCGNCLWTSITHFDSFFHHPHFLEGSLNFGGTCSYSR